MASPHEGRGRWASCGSRRAGGLCSDSASRGIILTLLSVLLVSWLDLVESVNISVVSPSHGSSWPSLWVNPGSRLQLRANVPPRWLPSSSFTWTSPNASILSTTSNLLTPVTSQYLVMAAGSLTGGKTYVFRVSWANGTVSQQAGVVVRVNQAPQAGGLSASPTSGTALLTSFLLNCTGLWSDADGHLPLTFTYRADGLVLGSAAGASSLTTSLPPSSSMRPSVVATDSLGAASTTVSTATSISVSPLTNGTLAAILLESARQRFNTSQARLNSSESAPLLTRLYSVVSSLNRSTYTSGSDGAIFGVALRTLEQAPSKVYLNNTHAAPLAAALELLSKNGLLSSSLGLQTRVLQVAYKLARDTVSEADGSLSTEVAAPLLRAISNVVGRGTDGLGYQGAVQLSQPVLTQLSTRLARTLVPGEAALSLSAPNCAVTTGLHESLYRRSSPYTQLAGDGLSSITIPAAAMRELAGQVCSDGTFGLRSTWWSGSSFQPYQERPATWPNQSVVDFQLTSCNGGSALSVTNLVNPLTITLAHSLSVQAGGAGATDATARGGGSVRCKKGQKGRYTVTCQGTEHATEPITMTVRCDGRRGGLLHFACPEVAACVFWNDTTASWSSQGCTTLSPSSSGTSTCSCSHLSLFTALRTSAHMTSVTLEKDVVVEGRSLLVLFMLLGLYGLMLIAITYHAARSHLLPKPVLESVRMSPFYIEVLNIVERQKGGGPMTFTKKLAQTLALKKAKTLRTLAFRSFKVISAAGTVNEKNVEQVAKQDSKAAQKPMPIFEDVAPDIAITVGQIVALRVAKLKYQMDLFRGALERLSGKQVVHKYTGGLSSELTAKIRPTTVDRIEVERLNMAQYALISLIVGLNLLLLTTLFTASGEEDEADINFGQQVGVLFGVVLLSWPLTQITEAILNASNRHGRFKPVVKYRLVETATHFNPLSEILDRYADGTPGSVFTPEELKARRLASLQVSLYQLELAKATLEQWRPTVSGGREKEQVERAERLGPRMLKMINDIEERIALEEYEVEPRACHERLCMAWRPRVNPLDVLDPVHAVVREFDNYVVRKYMEGKGQLSRFYYQHVIALPPIAPKAVKVRWELVAADAFIAFYIVLISALIVALSLSLNKSQARLAAIRFVLCAVLSRLVVRPFFTLIRRLVEKRIATFLVGRVRAAEWSFTAEYKNAHGSQVGRDRVDRDAELEMTSRGFLFLDDQGTPGDGLIGEEPLRLRSGSQDNKPAQPWVTPVANPARVHPEPKKPTAEGPVEDKLLVFDVSGDTLDTGGNMAGDAAAKLV